MPMVAKVLLGQDLKNAKILSHTIPNIILLLA